MDFSLDGRTALVTGSVRGRGLEMARGLAGAGARVVLNGRDAETLAAAAAELAGRVEYAAFDVTDPAASADALAALGQVDILVNNVGHRDRRGFDVVDTPDRDGCSTSMWRPRTR